MNKSCRMDAAASSWADLCVCMRMCCIYVLNYMNESCHMDAAASSWADFCVCMRMCCIYVLNYMNESCHMSEWQQVRGLIHACECAGYR